MSQPLSIHDAPRLNEFPNSLSGLVRRCLHTPVMTLAGFTGFFLVAFANLVDIEAENTDVGLSAQAGIKILFLALGGMYGGIGALTDIRVRKLLFSFPVMWIGVLTGLYFLAAFGSITKVASLAAAISILCVLLMTCTMLVQFGVRAVLSTLFVAASLYVALSWALFLFVPSIGVFQEPTVDGQTFARMGGLAHPNTLGQISGMTILLSLLLHRLDDRLTWAKYLVVALAAGALLFSLSRTSLLACIASILVFFRAYFFQRKVLMAGLMLAALGVLAVVAASVVMDVESAVLSKLSLFSKSGDTSELTSATGRTEIWSYALRLLGERPVFGYGGATTKFFLSEYSMHCHNLVLNIAFSTGVFGGLFALWMCLGQLAQTVVRPHPIADGLVVFILVNGLFENVIFSNLAGMPTIIWVVALAAPLLASDEANRQLIQQDQDYREQLGRSSMQRTTWRLSQ